MGNYSQVVVGGMLLIVAFFFGRYINQQPIQNKAPDDHEELVGNSETSSADIANPNQVVGQLDQQRSLRDRILSQRAESNQSDLDANPAGSLSVANHPSQKPSFADAIVEPDFSHLQTFESAALNRLPNLPTPELADSIPKTDPNPATRTDETQEFTGRFIINRPAPNLNGLRASQDARNKSMADRAARNTSARQVGKTLDSLKRSRNENRSSLAADNPRYRMVPVRERIGSWNPEPTDYAKYTTVFGDTLHSLSTKFFGTPDRYLDIYLANRELIESPSEVPVNTVIRIPVMK